MNFFKISDWLKTIKSAMNIDKTIFSLFHNLGEKRKPFAETLPSVNGLEIKQATLTKFLRVQVNGNINRQQQINLMQYKISENFGIMFKVMKLLEFKSLLSLYFSFLKKLSSQKRLALRLIFNKDKFESVEFEALKYLLPSFKALHIIIKVFFQERTL